ncbi:MAG: glycosyltransferase family 4 protein [Muribaculaceae bacterium]|nr:glycosyltransferase family 4 protein [Muribaculaceae bacterium]
MRPKKIFQLNTDLYRVTGIQRVVMDIHEALKEDFNPLIIGTIPFKRLHPNLNIKKTEYRRLKNPLILRHSVVIIHQRILLPFMWVLSRIPWLDIDYIYVHHNLLYGKRKLSLFPKNIIAISDSGIKNLTEYFKVPLDNINKIHNCVREYKYIPKERTFNPGKITILYPAGVTEVKRQLEIVDHLRGKLNPEIKIIFAGTGPLLKELKEKCRDDNQFQVLGFREDIPHLMRDSDFTMLFSKHEGLSIALIESTMTGTPIICNNVGGNCEIVEDNVNGYIVDSWDELTDKLNSLNSLSPETVKELGVKSRNKFNTFNFKLFKKKYVDFFSSLINSGDNS